MPRPLTSASSPISGAQSVLGPGQSSLRVSAGLLLLSIALFVLALVVAEMGRFTTTGLVLLSVAVTLSIIAGGLSLRTVMRRYGRDEAAAMTALLDQMPSAAILTDKHCSALAINAAARDLLRLPLARHGPDAPRLPEFLTTALRQIEEGPDPDGAVTFADGRHWTLTSRHVPGDRILWSVSQADQADQALNMVPILTLDRDGTISQLNDCARGFLGGVPARASDVTDAPLPASGHVVTLTTVKGKRTVLVTDLPAPLDQRRVALVPVTTGAAPLADVVEAPVRDWDRFENLPVPLLWLSPEGHVQRANRSALSLIGPQCTPGTYLGDLTEGLGRPIADWLDESLQGQRMQSPEFLRVTSSDTEVFVQMSLKPVQDGDEISLLAVLSDATELKTLEAQFVQSQKMQAIGQLAGGVAHDFNNLLTAISGHCDLLLLRHDQGDPDYADLMQINQNANRAASLVNQLLAYSRKQTLRPEEVDLRETVSDLTHLLNRLVGEKITLSFSHDPVLQSIRADKRQLEQVLMNLVVNARDAIPGNGEIRIVTESVTHDTPVTRDRATVPPGDYVSVKVIDTGCGIPPERLNKVFEPFYTTKRIGEGTGLGLSTAYGIIKQSGGYIFVDSTLGQGTCFTLLFRAYKDDQKVKKEVKESSKASVRHGDGVVLLVEDEAPVRAFASRALRLRGYKVLEAESGEEALEILSDPAVKVDIFVSDVVMPGMDGPTWVRKALETRKDVRVIFVSGYAEENFGDEQSRIPNSVFLPKPFSLSELTQTVQGVDVG
ncbi:ATP-binding protein [Pseudooceanicola onchidii]|uniref:ATP-binding protein n=1 Tax=Pseudooceanicola onchidii TaxID=2562279 RepID=UPI001F0FB709|nr:ATP-binding protein [Pseudooceanicola onchidii]